MPLTDAQVVVLNTDIDANSGVGGEFENVPQNSDGAVTIRDAYNANASPDYWIFRQNIDESELRMAINPNDMVNITATDKDRALALLEIRRDVGFDGTIQDVRDAWDDVFSAAAGDKSQQAIAALWRRLSTRGEKLFTLSTGAGTNADPDTTSFQGNITISDVLRAWALP